MGVPNGRVARWAPAACLRLRFRPPAPRARPVEEERFPMVSAEVQSMAVRHRGVLADFLPICCCLCGVGPTAKRFLIHLLLGQLWTGVPKPADHLPCAQQRSIAMQGIVAGP